MSPPAKFGFDLARSAAAIRMASENAIAKTGSESLDLPFDLTRHIRTAVERNMAGRPERVLTTRGARVSSNKLCCATNTNGRSGIFPAHNLAFCRRDFVYAAAEMNCACATASFRFPRDRLTQRIIDFENSRRMPK